jgi:hypothetical protein
MQGIVSGALVVAAFAAAAGFAIAVTMRLFRISRPGEPRARTRA